MKIVAFSACIFYLLLSSQACVCPTNCTCSDLSVTCIAITNFPSCLPPECTSLTIADSPAFTSITAIPENITELTVTSTGLSNVSKKAISKATALQTLHLSENANLTSLDLGNPRGNSSLTTLHLAHCKKLDTIQNVNKYTSLKSIIISDCNLRSIDDDLFKRLQQIEMIDISHNPALYHIDEDAFVDLDSLKTLNMSNCALQTLYEEYFDNAWHRDLESVSAYENEFLCQKMCEFTLWYWQHTEFADIADLGSCTIPTSDDIYEYYVIGLLPLQAGCSTTWEAGYIVGAVFVALVAIMIIIVVGCCILSVVCGVSVPVIFCCCNKCKKKSEVTVTVLVGPEGCNDQHQDVTACYPSSEKTGTSYSTSAALASALPSYTDVAEIDCESAKYANMPQNQKEPNTSSY